MIEIVERIPKTGTGKFDKKVIRKSTEKVAKGRTGLLIFDLIHSTGSNGEIRRCE